MTSRYKYIPIIKKIVYSEDVLIERALPEMGSIHVSVGDKLEPSQKIGVCKVSYELVELGREFKPLKNIKENSVLVSGTKVGTKGKKPFIAPYSGMLVNTSNGYIFYSAPRDYWLLPGVWGEVQDISHNASVLIKSQFIDVNIPLATNKYKAGELIVFPNTSEALGIRYFDNYLKSSGGKIVYVGNVVTMELVKKAHTLGVEAILGGSSSREVFEYALQNKIALGLFIGLGLAPTPEKIFNLLNDCTSRYVFFSGQNNILRIPVQKEKKTQYKAHRKPEKVITYVNKGLPVQVLTKDHFGLLGVVDRVTKDSIFVKLDLNSEIVEVTPPNLLAFE